MELKDYTEKSFVIIGDTKPHKEILKKMGGSWNSNLSCGAGWIFSKKNQNVLEEWLKDLSINISPQTYTSFNIEKLQDEFCIKIKKFYQSKDIDYKEIYFNYIKSRNTDTDIDIYFDQNLNELNKLFFELIINLDKLDFEIYKKIDRNYFIEYCLINICKTNT